MAENSVVREALDDTNYAVWSNCMKTYLVSQDLWDIIEAEENESKSWTIKNALALHAIHMSCNAATLSEIGTLESAKEVWDLLRSVYQPSDHDSEAKVVDDDHEAIAEQQLLDDSSTEKLGELTNPEEQSSKDEDAIDYAPLLKAAKQQRWPDVKEFFNCHPKANVSTVLSGGGTALHFALASGNVEIGTFLVEKINKAEDLEIKNDEQYTAFAMIANHCQPDVLNLLKLMVSKNAKLPNIGDRYLLPVVVASWKGLKDITQYLYSVTDKDILGRTENRIGVEVLVSCINIRLFDIASDIVKRFPEILQQLSNDNTYPIQALAECFSALQNGRRQNKSSTYITFLSVFKTWKWMERLLGDEDIFEESDHEKLVYNQALDFLLLVCAQVSSYDLFHLGDCVTKGLIVASKNGVVEFVSGMLIANPILSRVYQGGNSLFGYAIENRQEKVYNLIYNFIGEKDNLLETRGEKDSNVLHLVAKLPPSSVLNRSSGPALQMQRELQWLKEVWSLANPRDRVELNDNLTPRASFTESHAKLMEDGERAMKDTAQSSTVVGALIVTVMFAAAFTVPGGNNEAGLPIFQRKTLFRIFIVCDALSLYSSTTSVLVCLGILTSRYAEQDFFLKLPRKLLIGLVTLFFSITTMMISFCTALALILDGQLRYILPTVLLASVPIIMFMSSILPVMSEMFMSTFGPSIFDKSATLREKIEAKKVKLTLDEGNRKKLLTDTNAANRIEQQYTVNNPTSVDKNEDKNITYDPSSSDKV